MGAVFFTSARKTKIVSIVHAKVNSPNLSGLEQSRCLSAREHNQETGMASQGRERDFFFVPFEGNEGKPSLHGEMCATARTHLLGKKRATARPLLLQWSGSVRAATAGTVAPSHLLLAFGKLTTKFELPCKKTESPQFQNFIEETSGFFARRVAGELSAREPCGG